MFRQITLLIAILILALTVTACGSGATVTDPTPIAATVTNTVAAATDAAASPTAPAATPTEMPASEPAPTASPTAEPVVPSPVASALCPDLPRPALILSIGAGFEAQNPLSGERCPLQLPQSAGFVQPAGERLYFLVSNSEEGNSVVARMGGDGVSEPLEATRAEGDVHYLTRFAVAAGESRLAWSRMRTADDPNAGSLLGSLWIGAADGSEPLAIFADQAGGQLRIVTPIRFSADGATLFFTWEPTGLGGMWSGFNGRYDNIYRVPIAGGEPQQMFDCADTGLFLCVGDFLDDGTVAYIDTNRVIHVTGPDGTELAAIPTASDYAGYPTFSPTGDLYYSEAVIPANQPDVAVPAPGMVYRVPVGPGATYSTAPALVASADGLLPLATGRPFLDAEHIVVNYTREGMWGTALLTTTGDITRVEPWPNAYLAAVWPAN